MLLYIVLIDVQVFVRRFIFLYAFFYGCVVGERRGMSKRDEL